MDRYLSSHNLFSLCVFVCVCIILYFMKLGFFLVLVRQIQHLLFSLQHVAQLLFSNTEKQLCLFVCVCDRCSNGDTISRKKNSLNIRSRQNTNTHTRVYNMLFALLAFFFCHRVDCYNMMIMFMKRKRRQSSSSR